MTAIDWPAGSLPTAIVRGVFYHRTDIITYHTNLSRTVPRRPEVMNVYLGMINSSNLVRQKYFFILIGLFKTFFELMLLILFLMVRNLNNRDRTPPTASKYLLLAATNPGADDHGHLHLSVGGLIPVHAIGPLDRHHSWGSSTTHRCLQNMWAFMAFRVSRHWEPREATSPLLQYAQKKVLGGGSSAGSRKCKNRKEKIPSKGSIKEVLRQTDDKKEGWSHSAY